MDILLIDDEQEVHDLLSFILRGYRGARVVGHAKNVDEAVQLTIDMKPDLVLLDVQMPGKNGFSYIEEIQEREDIPGIIFVTAHEDFAIRAIRNAAVDYLLKPVKKEELFDALQRFESRLTKHSRKDLVLLAELVSEGKPERLRLNTRTGYVFINPAEIVYIEADGNYSKLHLVNDKLEITTMSLGMLEKKIDPGVFFRVSRSYIINMKCITRVDRKHNTCELENNGSVYTIKIPAQKIKLLEDFF